MQIQPTQNIAFTARNRELRYADKIMRNMLNNYPSVSTSKPDFYITSRKNPEFINSAMFLANGLLRYNRSLRSCAFPRYFTEIVARDTKETKVANCGELAVLSRAAFLANGFDNVKIVFLKLIEDFGKIGKQETDIDHCFLLVNRGNKARLNNTKSIDKHAIIVDAWLGFVDYINSGLSRYESLFMKGLKKGRHKKQKFILKQQEFPISKSDTCENFKKKFPELLVENTKNI